MIPSTQALFWDANSITRLGIVWVEVARIEPACGALRAEVYLPVRGDFPPMARDATGQAPAGDSQAV